MGEEQKAHLCKTHFSVRVYQGYLNYIRKHHPSVDLEKLCTRAGLSMSYLEDSSNWVSTTFDERFTRLAIAETRDAQLCYRVGLQSLSRESLGPVISRFVNAAVPLSYIYGHLPSLTALFSKVTRLRKLEERPGYLKLLLEPLLEELNPEERESLKANFSNIVQNTAGYYASGANLKSASPAHVRIEELPGPRVEISLTYEREKVWQSRIIALLPALSTYLFLTFVLEQNPARAGVWSIAFGVLYLILNRIQNRNLLEQFQSAISAAQALDQRYSALMAAKEDLRRLSDSAERFVPWEIAKLLDLESVTQMKLGMNVTKIMSVLFLDIREFSKLAESMSPQEIFAFLNDFFSRLTPAVKKQRGFIDKFTGDGFFAVFPESPDHALEAACAFMDAVESFNEERRSRGQSEVRIGIGIHTGKITFGMVGSENQIQATAISEVVNIASRLQELTKELQVSVLVGEASKSLAEHAASFHWKSFGAQKLRGMSKSLEVFTLSKPQIKNHSAPSDEPARLPRKRKSKSRKATAF